PISVLYVLSFTHPTTPALHPLPLHDALPISHHFPPLSAERHADAVLAHATSHHVCHHAVEPDRRQRGGDSRKNRHEHRVHPGPRDRKSTRLNSSHRTISYAVFCLKKKNK